MTDRYADLREALDDCGESEYHLHQYEEDIRALLSRYGDSQPAASAEPHGVIVCDKRIPNAMETFVPQRFFREAEWPDADYSKVVVYAAPVAQELVAYCGEGLKPLYPDELERLRQREPGTAALYDTPLFRRATPVAAEIGRTMP